MPVTASVIVSLTLPCTLGLQNVQKMRKIVGYGRLQRIAGTTGSREKAHNGNSADIDSCACKCVRSAFRIQAFNIVHCLSFSRIENSQFPTDCTLCPPERYCFFWSVARLSFLVQKGQLEPTVRYNVKWVPEPICACGPASVPLSAFHTTCRLPLSCTGAYSLISCSLK